MKCDLCNNDERLKASLLCAVCSEAIARVVWAQLRIEAENQAEMTKAVPVQVGVDADEYRRAFGGL